jgi:hypothetical protein
MKRTRLLLAHDGSDRATAYVMSNKIVRLRNRCLCTWLDSARRNQWALVDATTAAIVQRGPIGDPRVDNHCGAALATEPNGTVHLVLGDHHGQFIHYQTAPDAVRWELVEPSLGHGATYPSLVCDAEGHPQNAELVCELDPHMPNWLPSLERPSYHSPLTRPALLYTHGINSGKNRNDVTTDVWLDIPSVPSP